MDDFVSTKLLRSFSGSLDYVKELLKNLKKMSDVMELETTPDSYYELTKLRRDLNEIVNDTTALFDRLESLRVRLNTRG